MTNDQKLDLILEKLDEHSKKFEAIDRKLDEHSRKFESIDQRFESIEQRFESIDQRLDDHQLMLSALIHGQEELKAHFDGFKLETEKRFEMVKEGHKDYNPSYELLEKRTLANEKDIHRLKKLIGIE